MTKQKKYDKNQKQSETNEESTTDKSTLPPIVREQEEPKMRLIGLYGDLEEETASDTVFGLFALKELGKKEVPIDPENPESELIIKYEPFEFLISTFGGIAMDMFAIYDTLRLIRDDCEIHTIGMGKVMSAGVLLLAAGTKGKRRIGKNCRVMLHSVTGGHHGTYHNLENEFEEVKWIQEQHISALIAETNMTKKYLKRLLARKINVYFTAEEAVKLGIADEIF